jgi:hypothetical protein|tara:strand:- start:55 stop:306 length:252 start_codon:yes stop_codon:yes gene_type:complete
LLYRLYLIEFQKNPFNEKIQLQFNDISKYIIEKDLYGVDIPEEFDSFESFIIKMKLKNLIEDKKSVKTTVKRISDRGANPFLS